MTPEDWERVQAIFDAAVELPPAERDAWLQRECGDDALLAREVRSLLAADEQTDAMLDAPPRLAQVEDEVLAKGTAVGEYVIEAELGAGGFGRVYRAIHPVIRKPAAVKVLYARYSQSEEHATRFVNEARTVNEIGHPDIIDVFAFGQTEAGNLFFVMELVEAPTLAEVLREEGAMEPKLALAFLRRLARAVDAAHALGVVHRDLKPANVLVCEGVDGHRQPKLLDFGIAKLRASELEGSSAATAQGQIMGTPAYMAPEQARGLEVDAAADVYALGVIAFEMLTGQVAFAGATPLDTLLMQADRPPPRPSTMADLPETVDAVFETWLAKDPRARPSTCVEAVDRLEAVLVECEAAPTPPRRWGLGVAAAAVITAVAVFAIWDREQPRASGDERQAPAGPEASEARPVATPPPGPEVEPPPEVAEPEPAAAAVDSRCRVSLDGAPRGARAFDEAGETLGSAPGPVELPCGSAPVAIVLRHRGYKELRLEVTPDRPEQAVEATMQRQRKLNPDLESPFDR